MNKLLRKKTILENINRKQFMSYASRPDYWTTGEQKEHLPAGSALRSGHPLSALSSRSMNITGICPSIPSSGVHSDVAPGTPLPGVGHKMALRSSVRLTHWSMRWPSCSLSSCVLFGLLIISWICWSKNSRRFMMEFENRSRSIYKAN